MKNFRTFVSLLLTLLLALSLTACGAEESGAPPEAEAPEEAPEEEAPPEEEAAPAFTPEYGHTVPEADGILETEALKAGYDKLAHSTGADGGYQRPTYEEVYEFFGVHGMKSEGHWDERYHAYLWQNADDSARVLISFKVQPDGSETWASSNWSDNLG